MIQCLTCESKDFEILYKIKEFPLFWGAIPKNKVSDIPSYPLEISFCKQCGLVQQTKLVDEEIINKMNEKEKENELELESKMSTSDKGSYQLVDIFYSSSFSFLFPEKVTPDSQFSKFQKFI